MENISSLWPVKKKKKRKPISNLKKYATASKIWPVYENETRILTISPKKAARKTAILLSLFESEVKI